MDIVERSKKAQDAIDQMVGENAVLKTICSNLEAEVKRLQKVGKILSEEIVELTEELIKLRAEDKGPIDYIIDSHGLSHSSFTIVYKQKVGEQ